MVRIHAFYPNFIKLIQMSNFIESILARLKTTSCLMKK